MTSPIKTKPACSGCGATDYEYRTASVMNFKVRNGPMYSGCSSCRTQAATFRRSGKTKLLLGNLLRDVGFSEEDIQKALSGEDEE